MKIKWKLFQRAIEENYPISWTMLRIRLEYKQRKSTRKKSDTIVQRVIGYKRKRSRRINEKRWSINKNAKRTLLSRIPLTSY
jgi:hypothetical protein